MRDSQHDEQGVLDGAGVTLLAATAIVRLATRDVKADRVLNESVLDRLTAAVLDADSRAFDAIQPDLKRLRITSIDLSDHYFPRIARKLGADWADDSMSFANVSLGVARMQSILRQIGVDRAEDEARRAILGRVLLILPESEQHSFGAMVLMGQMRRRGLSVSLRIAPRPAELRLLLRQERFDGAMISVACREKVEICRSVVRTLKNATRDALKVAVGGAVFMNSPDVPAIVGADIITNDLDDALMALGLAAAGGVSELTYA